MTPVTPHATPEKFDSFAALAARYDGFLLDLWGVIHDGKTVFPAALAILAKLRWMKKRVVLISNAPRRESVTEERNRAIGLDPALVDGLVTSGEEAWLHMAGKLDAFHAALGPRCLHIGGARDLSLRDGLPFQFVQEIARADFILNSGSAGEDGKPAAEEALLQEAARRGLPMVCANPDRVVIAGGRRETCAGALAEIYEAMGGKVAWHGKPFPGVYRRALEKLSLADKSRVLAVGDGLLTDITGAKAVGIDALFIWGGIHRPDVVDDKGQLDPARLAQLLAARGLSPLASHEHFIW